MAALSAVIIKTLLSSVASKDGRKRLRKILTVIAGIIMLPFLIIGYIFTSPFDALGTVFTDPGELAIAESIYEYSPYLQINSSGDYDPALIYVAGVRYYSQKDPKWRDIGYGTIDPSGTIGKAGCGPTSAAMVLTSLTSETITPPDAAQWCIDHKYRVVGSGTLGAFARAIASDYGLLSYSVSSSDIEKLNTALRLGRLVIAHMGKGTFTSNGHYIVLCGLDADGRVYVADPNSATRSQQTWDLSLVCSEAVDSFVVIYPPAPPVSGGAANEVM